MPGHASVRAVADADDDLLADVAALGVADRVVEPGFERDRLLVHVHEEARDAGFDPQDLGRLVVDRHGAGVRRALRARRRTPMRGT